MIKEQISKVAYLITLLMLVVSHGDQPGNSDENSEEWIDPGDMLKYSPTGNVQVQNDVKEEDHSVVDRLTSHISVAKQLANKYYSKLKTILKPKPEDKIFEDAFANLQSELSHCHRNLENANTNLQHFQEKHQQNEIPTCDTPYFKQLTRRLLESVENLGEHDVAIRLSHDNLQTLKKYVNTDKGNVQDASEVIFKILANVKAPSNNVPKNSWKSLLYFLSKEVVAITLLAVIIIGSFVFLQIKLKISWRQQAGAIFIFCFLLSIPWEWFRLYRIQFANKQAQIVKEAPKHCQPDHRLSVMETFKWWGTYMFSVTDDACAKYQEAFLVDPLWEVTPSRAVSVTITRFFVQPLEYIAEAAGKSFRALFKEVPVQWQPFIFISILIIIILFLFFVTGAQVRLPFLTIGTAPVLIRGGNVNMGRIEGRMDDIAARMEQLHNQQVAIQEALPQENDDNVQNGFERIGQMMAALSERNRRQEHEVQQLRDFLMAQPDGNAVLAGENQQGRIAAVDLSAGGNEIAEGEWEVVKGASACNGTESNHVVNEERQPNGRPVENSVKRPLQETEQPTENIGSTSEE